jgi:positive regulator of sigma E activity
MSVMFLMMTMYAVLFAAMQLFGTPPVVFAVIAILVTGVGFGQMVLFGGKYPRAASIWTGAILFPIEILGVLIWTGSLKAIAILLICPPFGALFGYLAGCLAAGAFLLIELYGKRAESEEAADAEIVKDAEGAPTTAAPEGMTAEAE